MQIQNTNAGEIVPQKITKKEELIQRKKRATLIEKRDFEPVIDEPQLLYIQVVAMSDGSLSYDGRVLGYLNEFDRLYKKI